MYKVTTNFIYFPNLPIPNTSILPFPFPFPSYYLLFNIRFPFPLPFPSFLPCFLSLLLPFPSIPLKRLGRYLLWSFSQSVLSRRPTSPPQAPATTSPHSGRFTPCRRGADTISRCIPPLFTSTERPLTTRYKN